MGAQKAPTKRAQRAMKIFIVDVVCDDNVFLIVDEMELICCETTAYIYTCHNFRVVMISR